MVEVHTPSITNLDDQNEQEPREECGVYGVWAPGEEVSKLTYFGLFALQHRGQEAAGIAVGDDDRIVVFKDMGLVANIFDESTLSALQGNVAVGHTRYSTAGGKEWSNVQPMFSTSSTGVDIALGHNGNLINTEALRQQVFEQDRRNVNTDSDSEVLLNVFAYELEQQRQLSPEAAIRAVAGVHRRCKGGYAVVSVVLGLGLVAKCLRLEYIDDETGARGGEGPGHGQDECIGQQSDPVARTRCCPGPPSASDREHHHPASVPVRVAVRVRRAQKAMSSALRRWTLSTAEP